MKSWYDRECTRELQCVYYIDKPDITMNEPVPLVSKVLNKHIPAVHLPYWLGMCTGYCFDVLAFVTSKKLEISSVRVKNSLLRLSLT